MENGKKLEGKRESSMAVSMGWKKDWKIGKMIGQNNDHS